MSDTDILKEKKKKKKKASASVRDRARPPLGTQSGRTMTQEEDSTRKRVDLVYIITICLAVFLSLVPWFMPPAMKDTAIIYADTMINAGAFLLMILTVYVLLVPGTQDYKRIGMSLLLFIILFTTGDLVYSYRLYTLGEEPVISASDIFWILGYFPLISFAYYTVWKNFEHVSVKNLIFVFMGWVMFLICVILPFIIISYMNSEVLIETVVLSVYPILDMILLLPLAIILIIYREGYVLKYWIFITAGITAYVAGDLVNAFYPDPSDYYLYTLSNIFFVLAYFIIALGVFTMVEMRHKFQSIEPEGRYTISQVFVAHKGGSLVAHSLTREAKKCVDADIMVGMLTAIQDFVKETFQGEKHDRLDELRYGDVRLIFRRGEDFMLVVVLSGQVTVLVQEAMDRTLRRIEERFGAVLKGWDGDTRKVVGVKRIVEGLLTQD